MLGKQQVSSRHTPSFGFCLRMRFYTVRRSARSRQGLWKFLRSDLTKLAARVTPVATGASSSLLCAVSFLRWVPNNVLGHRAPPCGLGLGVLEIAGATSFFAALILSHSTRFSDPIM